MVCRGNPAGRALPSRRQSQAAKILDRAGYRGLLRPRLARPDEISDEADGCPLRRPGGQQTALPVAVAPALGSGPAPANLFYCFACETGQACLDQIEAFLDAHPACHVVIVDPFAKVRGMPDGRKATNAFQQDYADVGAFQTLAQRRGIVLLLVHHARKEDAADPFDSINGTTGIMAAADTILILMGKRGETIAQLSLTGRDIEHPGDFALEWDKTIGRFKVLGEANAVRQETMQDKIFGFLQEQEGAGLGRRDCQ